MKQTAVEWLATYLKGITSLNCDEVIEQAKAMEKGQIVKANRDGVDMVADKKNFLTGEQYYNEQFKKEIR